MTTSFFQHHPLLHRLLSVATPILALILTSCYPVKVNEIVTLEKNGSGAALLSYGLYMPDEQQIPQSRKFFEEVNEAARKTNGITAFNLHISHNKINDNASFVLYTATIQFDLSSALPSLVKNISQCPSLKTILEKTGTPLLSTDWSLESFLRPDKMVIQRQLPLPVGGNKPPVTVTPSNPEKHKEKDFLFMYTFPEKPENNNAQQILNDGKTLIWSYDLDQLPQEPQYQTFTLNSWHLLPQNTLVGLGGILTGAILATLFTILRRKKKKRTKNPRA